MNYYQVTKQCYWLLVTHLINLIQVAYRTSNFDSVITKKLFFLTVSMENMSSFLVIRDRLPKISSEDLFVLTKLFEIEGLIDYRTILDEKLSDGILRHIVSLPVPPSKQILLEKKPPKQLRQSFNPLLPVNNPR
jgi:hypothetical protein